MTTPTCPETVNPDAVHITLVKAATSMRCSTCCPRLEMHPLGNATGSRGAP